MTRGSLPNPTGDRGANYARTARPGDVVPTGPVAGVHHSRHRRAVPNTKDDAGLAQRQIAALTGQTQSEVSEILKGRQVIAYDVLVRLADGLGIPPERMGLSWWGADGVWYGPGDAYSERVEVAEPPEGDEMLRRQFERLLSLGAAAAFGAPIPGVGDVAAVTAPPLPAEPVGRIGKADVAMIRTCRERLRVWRLRISSSTRDR